MSTYALRATLRTRAERTNYRTPSVYRTAGPAIAVLGLVAATVAAIANFVAAGEPVADRPEILAWTFGLNTTALAIVKVGIAVTLVGILIRLWLRVESVKEAIPKLVPTVTSAPEERSRGVIDTPYGRATVSDRAPEPLLVHRMARSMWAPLVLMGPMVVAAGFVVSLVQSGESNPSTFTNLGAITQGGQFLGEAMILGGIAFLLGTILYSLRTGGGEVQESLGVTVKTLKMPASAKAFVGLMMTGMMLAVAQFVLYLVATGSNTPETWFAWLGPVRELSLGLILAGIVLALHAIGTALGFQFDRLKQLVTTGR